MATAPATMQLNDVATLSIRLTGDPNREYTAVGLNFTLPTCLKLEPESEAAIVQGDMFADGGIDFLAAIVSDGSIEVSAACTNGGSRVGIGEICKINVRASAVAAIPQPLMLNRLSVLGLTETGALTSLPTVEGLGLAMQVPSGAVEPIPFSYIIVKE